VVVESDADIGAQVAEEDGVAPELSSGNGAGPDAAGDAEPPESSGAN